MVLPLSFRFFFILFSRLDLAVAWALGKNRETTKLKLVALNCRSLLKPKT
jgi:hypothetical protein